MKKKALSDEEHNYLSILLPGSDNYQVDPEIMKSIEHDSGWHGMIDVCCDKLGFNALAPLCYSAFEDAIL